MISFRASWLCVLLLLTAGPAAAQSGVSDDRVSLPEGAGSVDGFSDNMSVSGNMGLMSYQVPIAVPAGYAGVTPELSLAYSSGTGNTVFGIGWDLHTPYIERSTIHGLPKYQASDEFAADGGVILVEVESDGVPEYRARFEKDFVRYRWHGRGNGQEGHWTAEYPDGTVGYFGADRHGNSVASARSREAGRGTFRYLLHEKVDPFEHVLRYNYRTADGGMPILKSVHYGPEVNGLPRYRVELTHEGRRDLISDCKAGFCEVVSERVRLVDIFVGHDATWRYIFDYEQAGGSEGLSRLVRIGRRGSDGSEFPAAFTFTYSRAIGEQCSGCAGPYLQDMSRAGMGLDIGQGYATLIDINGDALPDLLDTRSGQHTFYVNVLDEEGNQSFSAGYPSAIAEQTGFELSQPNTQVLDVDGDGFVDLVNRLTQRYLRNVGSGDWSSYEAIAAGSQTPDFAAGFEAGDARLAHVRFLDYDNDRQIDIIRSLDAGGVTMYRNTGAGHFQVDYGAADIGFGFDGGNLQFSDMNGDGLLDPVRVLENRIEYRLNLGWGKWGPWQGADIEISLAQLPLVELEDLNGDELSDIVVVQNDVLRYALNRNGSTFDSWVEITEVNGSSLPTREATTAVLYADMNANGSTDVVWADNKGLLVYLELFPARPNLLTRVDNGLGGIVDVTYGTSVQHMARDGGSDSWNHRLSHAAVVVDSIDRWDLLSQQHELRTYGYSHGYYDGLERSFRGFEEVRETLAEEASQQGALTVSTYNVGETSPYYASLLEEREVFALVSGTQVPLQAESFDYEECPLDDVVSVGAYVVRHICETRSRTTIQEGVSEDQWQTLETTKDYNGYGRVTYEAQLGVVGLGPDGLGGCPACDRPNGSFGSACGTDCSGDEKFTVTRYVEPGAATGDAWFLDKAYLVQVRGEEDSSWYTEEVTYYDGEPFSDSPLGTLSNGLPTRVTHRVDSTGRVINTSRNRFDSHGNVVETLDPNGAPDDPSHRRRWTYDPTGLRVVAAEVLTVDEAGEPYALVRRYEYDPLWDKPVEVTAWIVEVDGVAQSSRNSQYYGYDAFGRPEWRVLLGGDTVDDPTELFSYELGSPVSKVTTLRRSQVGGGYDLESVTCIDGWGREVQRKDRVTDGHYQVSGFSIYNSRGKKTHVYQPYASASSECGDGPPLDVLATSYRYDGPGRLIESVKPDEDLYGTASVTRTRYEPLRAISLDEENNDSVSVKNGLGQVVSLQRRLGGQAAAIEVLLLYDGLGYLSGYVDAGGHIKSQRNDLLGRVLEVNDPNAGPVAYSYDDAGNVVRREDGNGVVMVSEYDGANRRIARYEEGNEAATLVRWNYDADPHCKECSHVAGRLAGVQYPGPNGMGSDAFGYNARGQRTWSRRLLDGATFETWRDFDNADRLVSTTFPDGTVETRTYDGASRTIALSEMVSSVSYSDRGKVRQITFADGTSRHLSFDDRMRIAQRRTEAPDGTVLQGATYEHDRVGNILLVTDIAADQLGSVSWDASFEYDDWYRLVGASYGAADDHSLGFTFDQLDNLTAVSSTQGEENLWVGEFAYDGERPNAVMSGPDGVAMSYDGVGSMTKKGQTSFEWDHLGRLIAVDDGINPVAMHAYGHTEERVMQVAGDRVVHYLSPDFEIRDGISTTYARLGQEIIGRRQSAHLAASLLPDRAPLGSADGAIRASDAYLAALEGDALAGRCLRSAARRLLVRDEPVFLHSDHQGDLTLATVDGQAVGAQSFYPTGVVRERRGYVDVRGFAAQEHDVAGGLIHHRFRSLDPTTGRWLSVDPLFLVASADSMDRLGESTTAYAYVGNRFVNHYDPTGLFWKRVVAFARSLFGGSSSAQGGRAEHSRLVPGGGLQAHENAGGHTLQRHVGKRDSFLRRRLNPQKGRGIKTASTFTSRREAEGAISGALDHGQGRLDSWVQGGAPRRLTIDAPFSGGRVMARGRDDEPSAAKGVRVVLQGHKSGGWHILTGFPTP
jgi:RHS repeat-associated protein